MKRLALIELRTANAEDLTDSNNKKKIGTAFFKQSFTGAIERKVHYLTTETDMIEFKYLYNNGQIFIISEPGELKLTFNCIDWNLIDQELDFELEKINQLKTTIK